MSLLFMSCFLLYLGLPVISLVIFRCLFTLLHSILFAFKWKGESLEVELIVQGRSAYYLLSFPFSTVLRSAKGTNSLLRNVNCVIT